MDWSQFLEIALCPTLDRQGSSCAGKMEFVSGTLRCLRCSSVFEIHPSYHFPIFTARSQEEKSADAFENQKLRYAELYTSVWAFGYYFSGRGEAEGLFRTVNELTFTTPFSREAPLRILDPGCGIGRVPCDMARYYTNAFVVGLDISQRMLEQGHRVVIGDPWHRVEVSLEDEGLGQVSALSFGLKNVFLVQGDALHLPFASEEFDLVVSTNLIDRVDDPDKMISEIVRVLKPGGYFIMADPFNWRIAALWDRAKTIDQFKDVLTEHGLSVDVFFDGLVYKEILDGRGGHFNWRLGVVRAIKSS